MGFKFSKLYNLNTTFYAYSKLREKSQVVGRELNHFISKSPNLGKSETLVKDLYKVRDLD